MNAGFAHRLEGVGLSQIRQIMLRAAGCVNLGIGEVDDFAPEVVRRRAGEVLRSEKLLYSPNAGLPELCRAVRLYHGDHDSHQVCVTNGCQEALFDLVFSLVGPGDAVLVPDPGFVAYPTVVELAGGRPLFYPLPAREEFAFSVRHLESLYTPACKAVIINTPSNPTGQCLTRPQMKQLLSWASARNLIVISDEIYREIHFSEKRPCSAAELSEQAVILSGVSKMGAMTGWRLGWVCGPGEIVQKATVMHQYTSSCASTLAQKAALALLTPEGEGAVAKLRDRLAGNLRLAAGIIQDRMHRRWVRPQGAFYLMLSTGDLPLPSHPLALDLLQDGVATIPGSAFGPQGEGFLRISFAGRRKSLQEGLERLAGGLARIQKAGG